MDGSEVGEPCLADRRLLSAAVMVSDCCWLEIEGFTQARATFSADDEQAPSTTDQSSDTSSNKKSSTAAATPKVASAALMSRTKVVAKAVNRIISISKMLCETR